MDRDYTLADFDFQLPAELIAQHPAAQRSASRLLDGRLPQAADRIFRELPGLLQPQDLLVFNDTQVIKARLFGEKDSGGAVEALVERVLPGFEVWAHVRASKSPKPGSRLRFEGPGGDGFVAEVLGRTGPDQALFHLRFPSDPLPLLQAHGHVPLPPYIAHGVAALRRRCLACAGRARHPACGHHAACRGGHLPAGAHREPARAPDAQRMV